MLCPSFPPFPFMPPLFCYREHPRASSHPFRFLCSPWPTMRKLGGYRLWGKEPGDGPMVGRRGGALAGVSHARCVQVAKTQGVSDRLPTTSSRLPGYCTGARLFIELAWPGTACGPVYVPFDLVKGHMGGASSARIAVGLSVRLSKYHPPPPSRCCGSGMALGT